MSTLVITIGLPGSGKTTRARNWVARDPQRRVRVNRDDIRAMMHGGRLGTQAQEAQVTIAQHAAVAALLSAGDVVVDDTNLHPEHVAALRRLAKRARADFRVWDMRDVPVGVCIARDRGRPDHLQVGEQVVLEMAARHGIRPAREGGWDA